MKATASFNGDKSFIVKRSDTKPGDLHPAPPSNWTALPTLYEMLIDTNISNRYAHTLITSKVKNLNANASEIVFFVVLPKKAFITKFVMNINGKDYQAYITEKEKAKETYKKAVSSGDAAALVSVDVRESQSFAVSVNVEGMSDTKFYLTYEELLERLDSQYRFVVNINPRRLVQDLAVKVNIKESLPLSFVKASSIQSGTEISISKGDLDPRAEIKKTNPNSAIVKFNPNIERQRQLAKALGTNEEEGLSGQFIVQYDVERNTSGGEILLQDGYFVHFFAPKDLQHLPKYVLFVLDTSGSMYGTKLDQLKAAMKSILQELKSPDEFHLIEFNSRAKVLTLYNSSYNYPDDVEDDSEYICAKIFIGSYKATPDNIKRAVDTVSNMEADGGTNTWSALKVALHLVQSQKRWHGDFLQPMIIFLTDGVATIGRTSGTDILHQVSEANKYAVPIFSLSFGYDADRNLLRKLSLRNHGFSRHIYSASDAALQLTNFYKIISSPILNNITFKYGNGTVDVTKYTFPILFDGSELVVAGRLNRETDLFPIIRCALCKQFIKPNIQPAFHLERLWAYLTIQQLFDDIERSDNRTALENRALNLAKRYSFVTPLTSLVVVKPNSTNSPVEPKDLMSQQSGHAGIFSALPLPLPPQSPMSSLYTKLPPYIPHTTSPEIYMDSRIEKLDKLKEIYPWLKDILNCDQDLIPGDTFRLGLNQTSTGNISCPATVNKGPGVCRLLHECMELPLKTFALFKQYRCDMKGYVGICCPKK